MKGAPPQFSFFWFLATIIALSNCHYLKSRLSDFLCCSFFFLTFCLLISQGVTLFFCAFLSLSNFLQQGIELCEIRDIDPKCFLFFSLLYFVQGDQECITMSHCPCCNPELWSLQRIQIGCDAFPYFPSLAAFCFKIVRFDGLASKQNTVFIRISAQPRISTHLE